MSVESATTPTHLRLVPKSTSDTRLIEADHRIANSLSLVISLIRMQAKDLAARPSLSGAEAGRLLDEAAVRIEAISRWHRLLARLPNDRDVEAADFLEGVCEAAVASLAEPGRVALELRLEAGCRLAVGQAAPVALLLTEAITNAIKYAHPAGVEGRITVSCRALGDGLRLRVTDDGVGLPDGFDPEADGGLGLRVMRSLARQLNGELSFRSNELGLEVRLDLDDAEEA